MKKFIIVAGTITTLLIANPALSSGFNGRDLAKAANEAASAKKGEQVEAVNATEVFRLQMAYNPKTTFENQSEPIRQKLSILFGDFDNKRQYQTSWFMAGAIVRNGESVNQTRLYNPLAKIWLEISWVKLNGQLQISDINGANSAVEDWEIKSGHYLIALANSYIEAIQTNSQKISRGDTLFASADKWIQGLADWVLSPTRASAVEATQRQILAGECAKYGSDGAVIDTLPREVRASFAPTTGFQNNSGGAVLFGTPLFPQIIIAADYDNSTRPKLKNLTILNLSNANLAGNGGNK